MTQPSNTQEPDIGTAPDIESSSDEYAKRFAGVSGEWLLQRQCYFTQVHIQAQKPKAILDIGGGHAQNVAVVENLGIPLTITGSDSSCRVRVDRISKESTTEFMISPLTEFAVADRSFEHVISYRIVSHMIDWQGFIGELCRVSSSAVTIDFASKRSINFFSELAYKVKREQETDTRRYNVLSESDVDAAFAAHGFEKRFRSPQFFFPMAIHRRLGSPKLSGVLERTANWLGMAALFGSPVIATYVRES